LEQKLRYATDGNNGIWLCENHHKMLDEDILTIDMTGAVQHRCDMVGKNFDYINWSTPNTQLEPHVMTDSFMTYLSKRYDIAV